MEGLTQGGGGGGANFLSIVGGKIVMRVPEGTAGAVSRVSEKNGKTMHELIFDTLTGKITKFEIRDSEFGEQLSITVATVSKKYVLNIPVESRYFDHFAKCFKNIEYPREVRLSPYSFKDKENPAKTISGMNILQESVTEGWVKTPWFFTREQPNGMPVSGDGLSKDELKMHFMQVHIFLKNQIKGHVLAEQPTETSNAQNNNNSQNFNPVVDDDLPF